MGRIDDPRFEGRLLLAASDFLTVLLLTAGSALAFLSGYRLDVDKGAVLVFCVFASAVSTLLHSLSRPWWSIGAAAGIACVFWRTWEDASPILEQIAQKMNLLPGLYMGWSSRWEEGLLPVFLLLCAALAWLMGWMAARVRRWYLAALLSLILVLPAIQTGVLPSWWAMLSVFAGWGGMLLTSLYGRRDPGSLGRAQLLSLTGMTALILTLATSLPMEGYARPQWATDARNSLILGARRQLERYFDMGALESGILADLGLDLSIPSEAEDLGSTPGADTQSILGSGGAQRENLLAAGPRRYAGRRMLTVRTGQYGGGRIYLRGGSLGTYTGDSWEAVEAGGQPFFPDGAGAAEAQPALYPAQTAPDAEAYTMSVRVYRYQGVYYYPYRLTGGGWTNEAGVLTLPDDDAWIGGILSGGDEYQVDYVPGGPEDGFVPLPEALAAEESRYQGEVAYSARYLEVPVRARQALEPLLSADTRETLIAAPQQTLGGSDGDVRTNLEATLERLLEMRAAAVTLEDMDVSVALPEGLERFQWPLIAAARTAALLERLAVYDPDTPAMERGEDFVTHFLADGRGYCVHFATAGTLLLRMQGVPARYVTGYTVQLDGQGRGEALDSDAHAWVEIYLDGYGWYPVEMTPGYTGGEAGISLADGVETEEPDQPDEPEPEEDAPEEEPPEEAPGQIPLPGEASNQEEEAGESAFAAGSRRALAGIGLAACALSALYALAVLLRRREKAGADANRSVICAYRRYRRALRLGGEENETLEELGRKAKFSQHTLTETERETAWRCLDETVETARNRRKKGLRRLFSLIRPAL